MTNKNILKIDDFSFSYNGENVIEAINLSFQEGDYVSIIGPNGAGKSTLLKCINRILTGGQGHIELYGKELRKYSQKSLAQLVGYVPQTVEPVFSYSVREFVSMGRYPYLKPFARLSKDDENVVDEAIRITGLSSFVHRNINQLSGGEKQKVYIAACLAQQPKILLLDEPNNHLDPKHRIEVQQTISDISRKLNITIVHVTHDLSHITYWSQKIVALHDGKIAFAGPPQDLISTDCLKKLYDTNFHLIPDPKTEETIIIPSVELYEKKDLKA